MKSLHTASLVCLLGLIYRANLLRHSRMFSSRKRGGKNLILAEDNNRVSVIGDSQPCLSGSSKEGVLCLGSCRLLRTPGQASPLPGPQPVFNELKPHGSYEKWRRQRL